MDLSQITQQVTDMVNDPDLEEFTPNILAGLAMSVLENHHDELPEKAVSALFLISACLMRDHCNSVEKDILAARKIYQQR